jgi:hypothetical protein
MEGGTIASQALYKKLGLLPTCSILLDNHNMCSKTRVDMSLVYKSPMLTNSLANSIYIQSPLIFCPPEVLILTMTGMTPKQ